MCSGSRWLLLIVVNCAMAISCKRETRELRAMPAARAFAETSVSNALQPGNTPPNAQGGVTAANEYNPFEGNAYAISEGAALYGTYNCKGCHMGGGGDIGPALINETYRYGKSPTDLYNTIAYGRPNGMPAWGARIPKYQIWQLVAYVRSLRGAEPSSASPARNDALQKTREQTQ